jgi:hypothetical protein
MTPYNGKNCGVHAFEIGDNNIIVRFKAANHKYLDYNYTYHSAGMTAIEKMKALALAGEGLSTFINKNKPDYE